MSNIDYHNICSTCGKFSYLNRPCGCGTGKSFDANMADAFEQVQHQREVDTVVGKIYERTTDEHTVRVEPEEDPCPGRSQYPCSNCGKCLGLFEVCLCDQGFMTVPNTYDLPGTVTTSDGPITDSKEWTLIDLHEELGRLKWYDMDEDTITAVRKFIREKLSR